MTQSDKKILSRHRSYLRLVCKGFATLMSDRAELKAFESDKERWTKLVEQNLNTLDCHHSVQLHYFKDCVKALQMSNEGPVNYPVQSLLNKSLQLGDTDRAKFFAELSYLECQYLYLTELALFNRYFRWSFPLLEQLKIVLKEDKDTITKLGVMSKATDHYNWKKLRSVPNIENEHSLYLQALCILRHKKSVQKEYNFRYEHHMKEKSSCVIC